MNPILLKFVDGTSFFAGMGLVIVAVALQVPCRHRAARTVLSVLATAGAVLVVLSSTPLPVSAYIVWGLFLVVAFVALQRRTLMQPRDHLGLLPVALLVAVCLMLSLNEFSRRWPPRIAVAPGQPIVVIGDSISAGNGGRERNWPDVLAEMAHLPVTNLARAGATVDSALAQVDAITQRNALVLVEIGGNDILGTTDSAAFRARLDQLLEQLHRAGHRIVLFELPLPPLCNRYGKAQRDLAARYGAQLIPKRYFAQVLGLPGATCDGLHLSQKGHDTMAKLISDMIEPNETGTSDRIAVPAVDTQPQTADH